jgi:hypothetical protein
MEEADLFDELVDRAHPGCATVSRMMSSLLVAAGRTTAYGRSRHFAAAQQFGRIWSEADIKSQSRIYEHTP